MIAPARMSAAGQNIEVDESPTVGEAPADVPAAVLLAVVLLAVDIFCCLCCSRFCKGRREEWFK